MAGAIYHVTPPTQQNSAYSIQRVDQRMNSYTASHLSALVRLVPQMTPAYDAALIEDVEKEDTDTHAYYVECMAFLDDYLGQDQSLRKAPLKTNVVALLEYWSDPDRNPSCIEDALIDTFLFGPIGQAIYFLKDSSSPQFKKELLRLFKDINQLRGNFWLLYTAARFKIANFDIRFIDDGKLESIKTPDFAVTRGATRAFIEANARSQAFATASDQGSVLWEVLHGGKKVGKQLKFTADEYDPGIIALDLSLCKLTVNDDGLDPVAELLRDAIVSGTPKRFIYDTSTDPAFFLRPHNNNNVLRLAIDYFQMIDKERYKVRGLLIGQSMRLVRTGDGMAAPKRAVLIVDKRYPELAIQELATAVYLVEPAPPDLPAAVRQQIRERAFRLWTERGEPMWDAPIDWYNARKLLGVPDDFYV